MKQNTYLATYYVCHSNCEIELTKSYVNGFTRTGALESLMDMKNYLCMISLDII